MSFSQHLVLWLHVAFVIFTIGPVTMAIMSSPRYIRKRDIRILRYLTRVTFIFGVGSLGVLIAGIVLSSMIGKESKPWIIVSETLFLVSVLLLGLIHRDQRHAIKALEVVTATAATAADQPATGAKDPPAEGTGPHEPAGDSAIPQHLATVERGRIVMIGGIVTVIWLVILVLMVWNG
jgi:hypothetical protein